jgi:hypothetical protein
MSDLLPGDAPSAPQRDALEPDVYPVREGFVARVRRSEVWRSMFRHPHLDTPRGGRCSRSPTCSCTSTREGAGARVAPPLLVAAGVTSPRCCSRSSSSRVYLMFFYTPSVTSAYGDMQAVAHWCGLRSTVCGTCTAGRHT